MAVSPGTRFGVYEVVAPLGAGGMGEVYKARDPRLDRLVAVKILPRDFASDATARDRFEREARTASALNHPNILSVFDVGRDAGAEYLVTELVEGTTLRDRLDAGPLPPREVVHVGAQIADGLAAAHGAGLIHRDLKPANIMVTRDGRVKILDFGLAKPLGDSQLAQQTRTGISHAGLLVGTVGYIAPEQVRGESGDARSDLFALGVVLYEMTSGRRAFDRQTTIETLNAVLKEDAAELGEHTPEGLRQIIGHCLEKDPARRFQSAADVAFALRALSGGSTTTAQPVQHPSSAGRRIRSLALTAAGAVALAAAAYIVAGLMATPAITVDGVELMPFAVEAAAEHRPAIAPDGRSIAYVRGSAAPFELVVRSENSPEPTVLVRGYPSPLLNLFWSRESDRLYFESTGGVLRSIASLGGDIRDEFNAVNGVDLAPDGVTFAAMRQSEALPTKELQLHVGTRDRLRLYQPVPATVPHECVANYVRFSPDGTKILLWLACGGGGALIVRTPDVEGAGGDARRLWENQGDAFMQGVHWLNDSRHVVISRGDQLWIGDTESGSLTRLTTATMPFRLPMAGGDNTIAFTEWIDDYDLVDLLLTGGTPRPVVNSTRYDGGGVWSPRGGMFAYIANRSRGDEIWLRAGDSFSDRRFVTPDDFPDSRPAGLAAPAFSPDGQWLAFVSFQFTPAFEGTAWVMPIGGGPPRRVSGNDLMVNRVTWSPDGRRIALHGLRNGLSGLWIATIGSSERRQVVLPDKLELREIEWSPSGDWIAALEYRPDERRPAVLIDPTTGAIRRVPALNASVLAWAPDGKRLYGLGTGTTGSELRELDIVSGTVRTVATYDTHLDVTERTGNVRRMTFAPDGRSLLTTVYTNRSNVWLLKGLQLPRSRWWPWSN